MVKKKPCDAGVSATCPALGLDTRGDILHGIGKANTLRDRGLKHCGPRDGFIKPKNDTEDTNS